MHYRPEIDGLRALAVIPVVLFHLGVGCSGGFVGVDVFFVISGFLITGIIRREIEGGVFSFSHFWNRRVVRIFPALTFMLVATLVAGYLLLLPREYVALAKSSIAQDLFAANVFFWRDVGYFTEFAEFKPLLHTWSLAVEEQFYFVFPFVLFFLRRLDQRKTFFLLGSVAGFSFCLSAWGLKDHVDATFFLLPTRAWELLIGCMLAMLPWEINLSRERNNYVAMGGMLAILLSVFLYDEHTQFPGPAAIPPVLGAAMVIFATGQSSDIWLCKVLSFKPVVAIGLVSYSLYLWHWPVIVFTRLYFGSLTTYAILFALFFSLLMAVFSWWLVENPCRKTLKRFSPRLVIGSAVLIIALELAFCIGVYSNDGLATRFSDESLVLLEDVNLIGDQYEIRKDVAVSYSQLPVLGNNSPESQNKVDFIIWGDSHGMAIASTLDQIAKVKSLSGKAVLMSGVPPLPDLYRPNRHDAVEVQKRQLEIISLLDKICPRNLILVARWSLFIEGWSDLESGRVQPFVIADERYAGGDYQEPSEVVQRGFQRLADFCKNRGIRLHVVREIPECKMASPAKDWFRFQTGMAMGFNEERRNYSEIVLRQKSMDLIYEGLVDEQVFVHCISSRLVDDDGSVMPIAESRSSYRDNDHLSVSGSKRISFSLSNLLEDVKSELVRN